MLLVTGFSVLAELALIPGTKRSNALALARSLPVLEDSEEVQEVVEFYALHKLMPAGIFGDATHLALATVHKCDYLITWNCKHLANPRKLDHIVRVNWMLGLATPKIVTPLLNSPAAMSTKKTTDDGTEWLRQLRIRIAASSGFDLARQREVYRAAAADQPHRSFRGVSKTKAAKTARPRMKRTFLTAP